MGTVGQLRRVEDRLTKDLEETTIPLQILGKKYGVSKQAIFLFIHRKGVKRPKRPKGHQTGKCRLCQKLIQISKRPHSEFISIHTIVKKTGGSRTKCLYHLRTLRERGLVHEKFGRLLSKRAEKAYAIYFTKRLPIRMIGRKVGMKNFQSVIRRHRELGWNVPASRYVYDGKERSKIQSEIQRRKQR